MCYKNFYYFLYLWLLHKKPHKITENPANYKIFITFNAQSTIFHLFTVYCRTMGHSLCVKVTAIIVSFDFFR